MSQFDELGRLVQVQVDFHFLVQLAVKVSQGHEALAQLFQRPEFQNLLVVATGRLEQGFQFAQNPFEDVAIFGNGASAVQDVDLVSVLVNFKGTKIIIRSVSRGK